MDKRTTFMDDSEAESDGGEVSGLNNVSWVDSASDGSSFNLENQCKSGKFDPLTVLGMK